VHQQQRRQQRLKLLGPGPARFRELLGKVGSGEHTSTGLSRDEACEALELMLSGDLPPAQIAAFLIARRIRRPAPEDLAVQRWLAGLDPDLPSGLIWAWQRLQGGAAERLRQELTQGCS